MLPWAKSSQVHLRICQETLVEGVDSQVLMASVSGICKSAEKSAGLQTRGFSRHRGNAVKSKEKQILETLAG